MITRLKNRPRLDALDNQRRGAGKKLGRRIYLGSLYLIGAVILYFFFGSFFIMNSDGLVMKDPFYVETTFPAKVLANHVEPGAFVKKGDLLVSLESQSILDSIANVSAQRAELIAKEVQLQTREQSVKNLLPVAQARLQHADKSFKKINNLKNNGYITLTTINNATELLYATQREYTQLESETRTISNELQNVKQAREVLDQAIERLVAAYNDGEVKAPSDGYVGAKVPAPGEVYQTAETIMEILAGDPYILAYVPTNRFYSVSEGQSVVVVDGVTKTRGTIEKLGNVTDALPDEFQGAFRAIDRFQIMKISFNQNVPFVLKSKVKVTGTLGFNGAIEYVSRMLFGKNRDLVDHDTAASQSGIAELIQKHDIEFEENMAEPINDIIHEANQHTSNILENSIKLPHSVPIPLERPDIEYIEPVFHTPVRLALS